MKKIISLLILMLTLIVAVYSQNLYSRQYLENASGQELRANFVKARKLKKTGTILTLGGVGAGVTGIFIFSQAWAGNLGEEFSTIGPILFIAGVGAILIGLPSIIIGSIRVKKINNVIAVSYPFLKIDLEPCVQYNLVAQNYQPGLTLNIRF